MIPNILAQRYASPEISDIWSAEGKILLERELWIAVMKGQRELGIDIPAEAIAAYERVKNDIRPDRIMERERVTRHDVKARIDEFCDLAGHQHLHKGMTSRDLTENVEQLQVYHSLLEIRKKSATALLAFSRRAEEWQDVVISARTHNVAAQVSTFGKRMAMFGDEMLGSWHRLDQLIDSYPLRGLKGAVGTQLDQLNLFSGDFEKVKKLDEHLAAHLNLPARLGNVGQVYPRSLDYAVVSCLTDLSSGPSSFAKTIRLMAGHELASEGFAKGQTGSSAMPHKMNSRSCERINGFHTLLQGYLSMAAALAGDQWNEGDVSCSVVRRVMLPDAFFAVDGLLETLLTVLDQMELFPGVIDKEMAHYLPFLLSTTFLMAAVQQGAGREDAHEAIKEHAVAAVRALRQPGAGPNDLLDRLSEDQRLGLSQAQLRELFEKGKRETGLAKNQIAAFVQQVEEVIAKVPEASQYKARPIL